MVLKFLRSIGQPSLQPKQRSAEGDAEALEADIRQMARFLGMNLDDELDIQLLYIAEEAYKAPLPPSWTAHRDRDGHLYFYNVTTDASQYEHPADALYMLKLQNERAKRQKLREIAEQKKRAIFDAQMKKTICNRLGNRHSNFCSIEEVYDMAKYLGISIDDGRELTLAWIAKRAVLAPLPEIYDEYEDQQGSSYFHNRETGETFRTHPNDSIFFEKVATLRLTLKGELANDSIPHEDRNEIELAAWRGCWMEIAGRGFFNLLSFEQCTVLWFTKAERVAAALLIQRVWRGYKVRSTVAIDFVRWRAARKLQRQFRSSLVTRLLRTVFLSKKGAVIRIQTVWRRALVRSRHDVRLCLQLALGRLAASKLICAVARHYLARRLKKRLQTGIQVARFHERECKEYRQQVDDSGTSPTKAVRLAFHRLPMPTVDSSRFNLFFPSDFSPPSKPAQHQRPSLPQIPSLSLLDSFLSEIASLPCKELGPVRESTKRRSLVPSQPQYQYQSLMAALKAGGGSAALVLRADGPQCFRSANGWQEELLMNSHWNSLYRSACTVRRACGASTWILGSRSVLSRPGTHGMLKGSDEYTEGEAHRSRLNPYRVPPMSSRHCPRRNAALSAGPSRPAC